jgi:hypothetical protein
VLPLTESRYVPTSWDTGGVQVAPARP